MGFNDWTLDKFNMVKTIAENAISDMLNGKYDAGGCSITKSVEELEEYVKKFACQHGTLCGEDRESADSYCRIDMVMRGVIDE